MVVYNWGFGLKEQTGDGTMCIRKNRNITLYIVKFLLMIILQIESMPELRKNKNIREEAYLDQKAYTKMA